VSARVSGGSILPPFADDVTYKYQTCHSAAFKPSQYVTCKSPRSTQPSIPPG